MSVYSPKPTPEDHFISRMINWKFHSAEAIMPDSLDDDRRSAVVALSEVFGNCGWLDAEMDTIIAAAVAWVIKEDGL